MRMIPGAFRSRAVRALVLAAALVAAVPSVRWCPARWDDIATSVFLRCAFAASVGAPGCALSGDGGAPAPARAVGAAGCARCASACASSRARTTACGAGRRCPLAAAASDQGGVRAPGSGRGTHHRGRAYLIGDAAVARAMRSPVPRVEAPALFAGIAAAIPALEAPGWRSGATPVVAEARPSARPHNAPPPARAPPREA